jgi:hypothetical protein
MNLSLANWLTAGIALLFVLGLILLLARLLRATGGCCAGAERFD